MEMNPYQLLARRLDALPNGFPPAPDGSEMRLLAKLYTSEEAILASQLRPELESAPQIAGRIGGDAKDLHQKLKQMARQGLIGAGQTENGLGFKLIPFVVGIYENQGPTIDAELAALFEQYFLQSFGGILSIEPPVHRVLPVGESIKIGMEVQPFESVTSLIASMQSWGVIDCICRKQKQLIGEGCSHPLDVCMTLSITPGAFDHSSVVRALTLQEAQATLRRAAEAGLVHTVSNNQKDVWYICNCCTCSCGVLRGLAEMGIANVVARSNYINQVDEDRCILCGECVDRCPFNALSLEAKLLIDGLRCRGCGVCTLSCQENALSLVLRPEAEFITPPEREADWRLARARARNINLE